MMWLLTQVLSQVDWIHIPQLSCLLVVGSNKLCDLGKSVESLFLHLQNRSK